MFLTIKKLTQQTFPGSLYHYTLSLICLDMKAECSYWAKCKRLTTLWSAVICLVSPLKKVTLTVSPSADTSFLVPLGKVIRRSPPARTFSIWKDHDQVLSALYSSITPNKLTDKMVLIWSCSDTATGISTSFTKLKTLPLESQNESSSDIFSMFTTDVQVTSSQS